jgi:hypothetical protein
MDGSDFARNRHHLGKSQAQMAKLLGVSAKAVQSFEQGWRKVPAHVERQLLFLRYLGRQSQTMVEPCWVRKGCEPKIRYSCIAWELQAGELCWFVSGTMCEGKAQDTWAMKMELCRQCEVFLSLVPTTAPGTSPREDAPVLSERGRSRPRSGTAS